MKRLLFCKATLKLFLFLLLHIQLSADNPRDTEGPASQSAIGKWYKQALELEASCQKADTLVAVARKYLQIKDFSSTIQVAEDAYSVADSLDCFQEMASAKYVKGVAIQQKVGLGSAGGEFFDITRWERHGIDRALLADANYRYSIYLLQIGNQSEARKYRNNAIEVAKIAIKVDGPNAAEAKVVLANIYFEMGMQLIRTEAFEDSLELVKKALEYLNESRELWREVEPDYSKIEKLEAAINQCKYTQYTLNGSEQVFFLQSSDSILSKWINYLGFEKQRLEDRNIQLEKENAHSSRLLIISNVIWGTILFGMAILYHKRHIALIHTVGKLTLSPPGNYQTEKPQKKAKQRASHNEKQLKQRKIIHEFVRNNQFDEALQMLNEFLQNSRYHTRIVMLQSKLNALSTMQQEGVIQNSDYNFELNIIRKKILKCGDLLIQGDTIA